LNGEKGGRKNENPFFRSLNGGPERNFFSNFIRVHFTQLRQTALNPGQRRGEKHTSQATAGVFRPVPGRKYRGKKKKTKIRSVH